MPVARQVDDVDAMVLRERGQELREQPAVQREAVQQHERASLPDGLDVQARRGFASRRCTARRAHAASRERREQCVDIVVGVRGGE